MFGFIMFIFFILFLTSFPYKKTYLSLKKHFDVNLLLTAIVLIIIPVVYFLIIRRNTDIHLVTSADIDDRMNRMNLTLNGFADVFGWLCLLTGVIILLFVVTQTIVAIKENKNKNNKNDKDSES